MDFLVKLLTDRSVISWPQGIDQVGSPNLAVKVRRVQHVRTAGDITKSILTNYRVLYCVGSK